MNSLVLQHRGNAVAVPGTATKTHLSLPPLPMSDYQNIFNALYEIREVSQWYLGDLMLAASAQHNEMAAQLADAVEHNIDQLKNWRWVADRYAPEERIEGVNYSCHREAAAIDDPVLRKALLEEALRDNLTTREVAKKAKQIKRRLAGLEIEHDPSPRGDDGDRKPVVIDATVEEIQEEEDDRPIFDRGAAGERMAGERGDKLPPEPMRVIRADAQTLRNTLAMIERIGRNAAELSADCQENMTAKELLPLVEGVQGSLVVVKHIFDVLNLTLDRMARAEGFEYPPLGAGAVDSDNTETPAASSGSNSETPSIPSSVDAPPQAGDGPSGFDDTVGQTEQLADDHPSGNEAAEVEPLPSGAGQKADDLHSADIPSFDEPEPSPRGDETDPLEIPAFMDRRGEAGAA